MLNPSNAFAKTSIACDLTVISNPIDTAVAVVPPIRQGFLPIRSPMMPAGRENKAAAKDEADNRTPKKYSE